MMENISFVRDHAAIWSTVEELRVAPDLLTIKRSVETYCGRVGFDNSGFAYKPSNTNKDQQNWVGLLNLPPQWQSRYKDLEAGKMGASDPVIEHVTRISTPCSWDRTGNVTFTAPNIAKRARKLLGIAAENGMRVGLTIPLIANGVAWSYLVLTINGDGLATDLVPELPFALLLGQSVLVAARRILNGQRFERVHLTNRETEILQWCSVGKTTWEISKILNVCESTVTFHVSNLCRKLETCSRQAACAKAIGLGLIDL